MAPKPQSELLTIGSLFAGIGGLELGLEWTGGFRTVWQVENDRYATRVLEKHWPDVRRWGDVATFPPDAESNLRGTSGDDGQEPPDGTRDRWYADLICGGFPCQDISYAGKGAGLDGSRSGLWYEFARVIGILRPRIVLVENVAALLTRGLDSVLGTLASLGYDAEWHCIPAAAVGAPHIRDRVFILAYAKEPVFRQDARGSSSGEGTGQSQTQSGKVCQGMWCADNGRSANTSQQTLDVADAGSGRTRRGKQQPESGEETGDVAYANRERLEEWFGSTSKQGQIRTTQRQGGICGHRWTTLAGFCRMAHGVSQRLDQAGEMSHDAEKRRSREVLCRLRQAVG